MFDCYCVTLKIEIKDRSIKSQIYLYLWIKLFEYVCQTSTSSSSSSSVIIRLDWKGNIDEKKNSLVKSRWCHSFNSYFFCGATCRDFCNSPTQMNAIDWNKRNIKHKHTRNVCGVVDTSINRSKKKCKEIDLRMRFNSKSVARKAKKTDWYTTN